jgi:hypothetical protein
MDVFERDVTVATSVFGSMEFYLAVDPTSTLAFEGEVTFRTKTVSRSDAVVFKDIQTLTELAATAALVNGEVIPNHWRMSATVSANMGRKVASSSSMLFQINCIRIGATTETFKKIG